MLTVGDIYQRSKETLVEIKAPGMTYLVPLDDAFTFSNNLYGKIMGYKKAGHIELDTTEPECCSICGYPICICDQDIT